MFESPVLEQLVLAGDILEQPESFLLGGTEVETPHARVVLKQKFRAVRRRRGETSPQRSASWRTPRSLDETSIGPELFPETRIVVRPNGNDERLREHRAPHLADVVDSFRRIRFAFGVLKSLVVGEERRVELLPPVARVQGPALHHAQIGQDPRTPCREPRGARRAASG